MTAASVTLHDEALERARGEWAGLLARCARPLPFVTPAFQHTWLRHFQGEKELRLLTAREGGRLVGVAPMLRDGDTAEFVGHYSICDYMDVAAAAGFEREFAALVLRRLAGEGVTSLDLRGLLESSPTLDAIAQAAPAAGFALEREEEATAPAAELPGTWDEYLSRLTKKDRHELRRKLRRLDSAGGDVQFRAVTDAAEADALLDPFFRMMRASNHHKEEFLGRPGMVEFFRDLVRAMAEDGMLRFYWLTFDGQPVAGVLNFDVGGRLYMYNSGYDPEYSHYAVGLMSKTLLIRDAIECGRTCVDFMRGDESYKYDLGGQDQKVFRLKLTKA
ncbi:MAG TPA: GNAT family N-acetyltransferase [Dehalococcoidia bacterium]|nr:GNAT family N-acetyltransferase [Dehalococcoidia bacterium]